MFLLAGVWCGVRGLQTKRQTLNRRRLAAKTPSSHTVSDDVQKCAGTGRVEERGILCWNGRRGWNRRGQEGDTSIIGVWASSRRRRAAAGSCKNAKDVLASSNVWPLSGGWSTSASNHLIPIQSYPEDTEEMVAVPDIVFTRASSLASGGRTPRRGSLNHWSFSTQ